MNGELTSTWKQPSVKSKNNNTIYFTFRLSWQWHPDRQTTSLRSSNCLSSSFSEDFLRFFFTSQVLINNHNYLWQLYWQQAPPSYPMRSLLASQVRQLSRTGRIYPLYVPRYLPLKKTARLSSFSN